MTAQGVVFQMQRAMGQRSCLPYEEDPIAVC